ncbi:MAG: polyisoprenoid-binding protein [Burkholderiales bacterium]|nr:YceI family protein [Burkholderiales bacterium]MDE1927654.1 polyisoprenoid-binding protein [Burkholderiales bacterium]MDE2158032.1 polyisoprenoid-binding protein [Burkholderiales bacterium]MDE2503861.1 polyisoprenoid-binding protein [Burkholderiales bacterium]
MKQLIIAAAVAVAAFGARAEATTYTIDPNHTFTTFEIGHMGTSTIRGRFDKKSGSVQVDGGAKTGHVEVTIDLKSVSTGVEHLDKHLESDAFFDVAKYPTATFKSDKFDFDGANVAAVEGQLTMHGKTVPVTLKADRFNCYMNPMYKRQVCGGDFETTLHRKDFGIDAFENMGAPDDVHLLIEIEAIKQ